MEFHISVSLLGHISGSVSLEINNSTDLGKSLFVSCVPRDFHSIFSVSPLTNVSPPLG